MACAGFGPARAQEARQSYNIPSQRADMALQEFARQSGRQILFPYSEAVKHSTPDLRGRYTEAEALDILARAAGLSIATNDARIIALMAQQGPISALVDRLLGRGRPVARPAPPPPIETLPQVEMLDEIVVTANRQSDLLGRVPLSITALSQHAMDQAGIETLQDLSRAVVSVAFRRNNPEANPNVSIRGIGSQLGAPTTGIYLDDTPLQKRDNPGSASGNGTPFPQLFDLERVEVLRGPQGTLYGSSAEGGAVRFITPAPSLTTESVYAKAQVSQTQGGGISYEGGVAVGGPVIRDVLGFRASVASRHAAGWIDEVSLYDGHTIAPDINSGDSQSVRIALTWAPTARLKVTPAFYYSDDRVRAQDVFWENIPAYTVNSGVFTNAGVVNGVRFDFPDKAFAGGTYGPFRFGPGKSGAALYLDAGGNARLVDSPRNTSMAIPALTVDYAWPFMTLKSITSLIADENKGYTGGQVGERSAILPTTTNPGFVDGAGSPVPGGLGVTPVFLPGFPNSQQEFHFTNSRQGLVQELRFASAPNAAPVSWVGGLYLSRTFQHQFTYAVGNEDAASIFLRGISEAWLLGQTNFPGANTSQRDLRITETETAAFGEMNLALTRRLKLTGGIRLTHGEIDLEQQTGSSVQGAPASFIGAPADTVVSNPACAAYPQACNGPAFHPFPNQAGDYPFIGFHGRQIENPITPKVALSWQADDHSLYYASAAKGFRSGGLNQPVPVLSCAQDLTALGLTSTPLTYNSDSVWSYEAGAKIQGLHGLAQINSSVFYIDWKNPQLQNRLRCGQNYVVNAGEAISQGFDIQALARLKSLTLSGGIAYTDAKYTKTYAIPGAGGQPITIVNKGDRLGAPDWQADITAQYDFDAIGRLHPYVRGDYQYTGPYQRGVGLGAAGYDPATVKGAPAHFATARAGASLGGLDVNLFVNNLFNSQEVIYENHVAASPLVTAGSFRPREIGLQASFRY